MPSATVNHKWYLTYRPSYFVLCTLYFALLLVSCEQRPEGVLSKGEMEEVLYDYHLTQAMADWMPDQDGGTNQPYLDAVFRKHGITQAEFDSSLVWYNAHASDLKDIYDNLKDRFTFESQKLQISVGDNEMAALFTEGGDTTNLWNGPRIIVLRNHPLLNLEKFTVKDDSLFARGDRFLLKGDIIMMNEELYNRNAQLVVALSVQTTKDKTHGDSQPMESTGNFSIDVEVPHSEHPRQVTCYFQYQSPDAIRNFCLIRNISLIRMHTPLAETDTLAADTLTAPQPQPSSTVKDRSLRGPRLSPEQLRKQSQDNIQKIEIRTAPEHRTPNSFGPSRRKR